MRVPPGPYSGMAVQRVQVPGSVEVSACLCWAEGSASFCQEGKRRVKYRCTPHPLFAPWSAALDSIGLYGEELLVSGQCV